MLRRGGSVADASLATAAAQIVLTGGAHVSFAGFMTALYFQKSSQTVFALDAGYNAPLEELQPSTIPGLGTSSGRSVLVPGFWAGFQALHQKFGRLPFFATLEPALELAEQGGPVGPLLAGPMNSQAGLLKAHPQMSHLLKADGKPYQLGERFRQPALAETLRKIAKNGTDEIYRGEWAHDFVQVVQQAGGRLSLEDLKRYTPVWSQPLIANAGPYRLYGPGIGPGGMQTLLALKLLDQAGLSRYDESALALDWLLKILRVSQAVASSPQSYGKAWGLDLSDPIGQSASLWQRMQAHDWKNHDLQLSGRTNRTPSHSAGIVAMDSSGDAVALLHTINTYGWGSTGLCVGGIPVPDSGALQQVQIAQAGPGGRILNTTNPLLAIEGERLALVCSAIGAAGFSVTVENVWLVINQGLNPFEAADAPKTWGTMADQPDRQLLQGRFNPKLLSQLTELDIRWAPVPERNLSSAGHWVGLRHKQQLEGGGTSFLNGRFEGY
ncbi:MAG: gamma-glutamyltransferase [Vulcanimicrobiota bacterium]